MPRRPRVTLPHIPLHVIQRGNNRQACFYGEEDYLSYLGWLQEYAEATECKVHAYVLMTNHMHLLVTPGTEHGVGKLMKRLGQRYVQYINRTYRRSGTLWEGRFRSCLVQEEDYLLGCYRYIELNPVRAAMVGHPAEYRWSSYRSNAQGENSGLLAPHPVYLALGKSKTERYRAYGKLFRSHPDSLLVDEIRAATNSNYALGSTGFREDVGELLGRRVSPGKSGRPRKATERSAM